MCGLELICVSAPMCIEGPVFLESPISSVSYNLSAWVGCEGFDEDTSLGTECSKVFHSFHSVLFWVYILVHIDYKRKPFQ